MINGEGAAAFILESRQHAAAPAPASWRELPASPTPTSTARPANRSPATRSARSSARRLAAAKLEPAAIGHVNAHGLSTVISDRVEAQAIRDTLGDVPVTALKSYFGNLGAGTGAVEMVGSLLAITSGAVPPTLNYERPDPQCPVNVVHTQALATNLRTALVLNHNTMGQAAAMVLTAE